MTGFAPNVRSLCLLIALMFVLVSVTACNKGVRPVDDGFDRAQQNDDDRNDRDEDDDRREPPDDNDPDPDDEDRPDPPDNNNGEPDPDPNDDRPNPPDDDPDDDDIIEGIEQIGDDEGNLLLVAYRPDTKVFNALPTMCFSFGYIRDLDAFLDGDDTELGHWVEGGVYCSSRYRTVALLLDTDGEIEAVRWSVSFSNGSTERYGCEGFQESVTQHAEADAFYEYPRLGIDTPALDVQLYWANWYEQNGDPNQGCGYVATVDGRDFPYHVTIPGGPGRSGP